MMNGGEKWWEIRGGKAVGNVNEGTMGISGVIMCSGEVDGVSMEFCVDCSTVFKSCRRKEP
jgi:hypothetical protein